MSSLILYLNCLHLHIQWLRVHFCCMIISVHIYSKIYPLEKHKTKYILRYLISDPLWNNFVKYNPDCVVVVVPGMSSQNHLVTCLTLVQFTHKGLFGLQGILFSYFQRFFTCKNGNVKYNTLEINIDQIEG